MRPRHQQQEIDAFKKVSRLGCAALAFQGTVTLLVLGGIGTVAFLLLRHFGVIDA